MPVTSYFSTFSPFIACVWVSLKLLMSFFWHKAVREYNINCFFFHLKYCAHFNSHIIHRKHVLHFFLIYISIYLTILYQFHCISVPTHYTECARVPGHIVEWTVANVCKRATFYCKTRNILVKDLKDKMSARAITPMSSLQT